MLRNASKKGSAVNMTMSAALHVWIGTQFVFLALKSSRINRRCSQRIHGFHPELKPQLQLGVEAEPRAGSIDSTVGAGDKRDTPLHAGADFDLV